MGNIYSMPLMIRRGGTKVKNLGLQSYLRHMDTLGVFETANKHIGFGAGQGSYEYSGVFYLGAKNVEFINSKSSNLEYWGIPLNNTLNFAPINDNDSFKYAIISLDDITKVSQFATHFAGSSGFHSTYEPYLYPGSYPNFVNTVDATLYPFVYESKSSGSTKQQKLTTYSIKAPNSSSGRHKAGSEPMQLAFAVPGNWSVYSSSGYDYQDYANKLINHLGSYTQQISGSTITWGFLAILRGSLPSNWTPRLHIRWFLQRCTDIDVDNDWAHIQLT